MPLLQRVRYVFLCVSWLFSFTLVQGMLHADQRAPDGTSFPSAVEYGLLRSLVHHDRSVDSHRTITLHMDGESQEISEFCGGLCEREYGGEQHAWFPDLETIR